MKDRVSLYPGRMKLAPVAGQENTYDMVRADSPTQEGTPLNKDSLLKDATAALYGLGSDALPDEVFAHLKTLVDNAQSSADSKARIQTGSYVGTGTYGKNNPCSVTLDFIPRFFMILGHSSSDNPYAEEGTGYAMACFDKIGNTYPAVSYNSTDSNGFGYHAETGTVGKEKYYASRAKLVNRTFSWFTQGYDKEDRAYLGVAGQQYNLSSHTYYWIAIG